ncbi:hypothetical protein DIPPA_09750 [Diplonema papillatum]|nr:hypothetical protein DIPPA_09750 [Diplonema papillatum]
MASPYAAASLPAAVLVSSPSAAFSMAVLAPASAASLVALWADGRSLRLDFGVASGVPGGEGPRFCLFAADSAHRHIVLQASVVVAWARLPPCAGSPPTKFTLFCPFLPEVPSSKASHQHVHSYVHPPDLIIEGVPVRPSCDSSTSIVSVPA